MNIAHLLPYSVKFPLKKHNGRYEWALRLATLQAEAGHKVTVYCAPGSNIKHLNLTWRSINFKSADKTVNNMALLAEAFSNKNIDLFHSHFDYLHYFLAIATSKPIVYTQHIFPNKLLVSVAHLTQATNVLAVPVTHFMARENKKLGIASTAPIYHGIDLKLFYYTKARGQRFLFVGRIAPHKGVKEAVYLAKKAGINLDIIGKINSSDQAYWEALLPEIDGQSIRYLGAQSQTEVANYMQHAKALLFPNKRVEAFGQTIVEAQACGLPVIASELGASSELIIDEKTGFLAKTNTEFLTAIKKIDLIKPRDCRSQAEKFDVLKMTERYEKLYKKLNC